jgi:hypothetical protein
MSPDEVQSLQRLAEANGHTLTINPHTGLPEAFSLGKFLKAIAPTALGAVGSYLGFSPLQSAFAIGGGTAILGGSLEKGLMAGLGAYGGATLTQGLAGLGEGAKQGVTDTLAASREGGRDVLRQGLGKVSFENIGGGLKALYNMGLEKGVKAAYNTLGPMGIMAATAPISAAQAAEPAKPLPTAGTAGNWKFSGDVFSPGVRNPRFGEPGQPYFLNRGFIPGPYTTTFPGLTMAQQNVQPTQTVQQTPSAVLATPINPYDYRDEEDRGFKEGGRVQHFVSKGYIGAPEGNQDVRTQRGSWGSYDAVANAAADPYMGMSPDFLNFNWTVYVDPVTGKQVENPSNIAWDASALDGATSIPLSEMGTPESTLKAMGLPTEGAASYKYPLDYVTDAYTGAKEYVGNKVSDFIDAHPDLQTLAITGSRHPVAAGILAGAINPFLGKTVYDYLSNYRPKSTGESLAPEYSQGYFDENGEWVWDPSGKGTVPSTATTAQPDVTNTGGMQTIMVTGTDGRKVPITLPPYNPLTPAPSLPTTPSIIFDDEGNVIEDNGMQTVTVTGDGGKKVPITLPPYNPLTPVNLPTTFTGNIDDGGDGSDDSMQTVTVTGDGGKKVPIILPPYNPLPPVPPLPTTFTGNIDDGGDGSDGGGTTIGGGGTTIGGGGTTIGGIPGGGLPPPTTTAPVTPGITQSLVWKPGTPAAGADIRSFQPASLDEMKDYYRRLWTAGSQQPVGITQPAKMASGGIASLPEYRAGGHLLDGPGDGMSDSIPAVIKGAKPQRAALADGEFVVPADVVSHLGNGSTKAGAKHLYNMMDRVRKARTGSKQQGRKINPGKFLPV